MSFQNIHLFTINIECDEEGTNSLAGLTVNELTLAAFYSAYQTMPGSSMLYDTIIAHDIPQFELCPHPFITTTVG